MSRKKSRRRSSVAAPTQSHTRPLTTALVLVFLAASAAFAQWSGIVSLRQKPSEPIREVAPQSFAPGAPSKEYVYAGGRLIATEEPVGCSGGGITASANLIATFSASPSPAVDLTWSAFSGPVHHYEVERRSTGSYVPVIFNVQPANPNVSVSDTSISLNTAYLYKVRAFDSANCPSDYSNIDLATTATFSDPVITPQITTIKAIHLTELFTAVNAVRVTAGMAAITWPTPPGAPAFGGVISKVQVQSLRDGLTPARSTLSLPAQPFTNNPLNTGDTVFAAHIVELRNGVK